MKLYSKNDVIEGVFKAELKNRFLCTVCINGEDVTCYLPSSCRLNRFIDLKNKPVILRKNASPKARTRYAVVAFKHNRSQILLNLAQVNQVIEDQLTRRHFSFLGKRQRISHEVNIGGYRSDLYIEDTDTLVEIKTLLAFEETASFPSVHSERAIEQLRKLSQLLDEGYRVCYLIVSLSPKVREVAVDEKQKEFWKLFQECIQKGMFPKAVSIRIQDGMAKVCSSVKVIC